MGNTQSSSQDQQQHQRALSRSQAEQAALNESPRRRRARNENRPPSPPSSHPLSILGTSIQSPIRNVSRFLDRTNHGDSRALEGGNPWVVGLETRSQCTPDDPFLDPPLLHLGDGAILTQPPVSSESRTPHDNAQLTTATLSTPPPTQPNARSIAQQRRRERERAQRASTSDAPPSPLPTQPNARAIAQQRRRERERAARESMDHIPPLHPPTQPNARSVAQQRRRERERAQRASTSDAPPTPPPTQPNARPSAEQRQQEHEHVEHSVDAGDRPPLPPPAPSNARSIAQQRRRERERAQRASTSNAPPTPPPTQPAILAPNDSAQSISQRARRARERAERREHQLATQQPPTPPTTQRATSIIANLPPHFMAARQPYVEPAERHYLGRMDVKCPFCNALHWNLERVSSTARAAIPGFGMCCNHGKVRLPPLLRPPDSIYALFEANDAQSREFRQNLRTYNMALAFTSIGIKQDDDVNTIHGGSAWVFRIQGQLCHRSGALEAPPGRAPAYAQLYVYDPQEALRQRMHRNSDLRPDTMSLLQNTLSMTHRYAHVFRHAFEVLQGYDRVPNASVRLRIQKPQNEHARQHNLPTVDEVAMILPGDGSATDYRDIILHKRMPSPGPTLYRINEGHPAYLPLHYVLFFPYGENGWHNDLWQVDPETGEKDGRITITKFAAYRIHSRQNEYSALLRGGRLFQQFLVDLWACADQDRLQYLRTHQHDIRADLYSGIADAFNSNDGQVDLRDLGQRYILPSSYIGGPRHMQQRFQDAMAIARRFRKVDLFITVTANPHWKEIQDELLPGQTAFDRPDLVARVFQLKKRAILEDITKHGIFGHAVAHVYTIEFQKRGLPHMHLLIFLADHEKLLTPEDIDACISAEWPDPESQPLLFETVKRCMVHGPCGPLNPIAPCMENGRCTKFYPKAFQPFTRMDDDGYPLYRRRNDQRTYLVGSHHIDNRWIIPYCPFLSARYNCHINAECAVMLRSVKYPFKYIHKGGDRATLEFNQDEITTYLQGRYIAASEAVWRLLHFSIHDQKPHVVRLQVHLPGQHLVTYNPDEDPETVLERSAQERTMLTEFFAANRNRQRLGREARKYTYQEFPFYLVWNSERRPQAWALRCKDIGSTIGRMYFVPPSAGERFYLRTLLTVARGPQSFEDLRTYRGTVYPTFRDACLARGLLEDDGEWRACLQEASVMQTGSRLRHLFATLLLFCHPVQPELLWNDFRHHICDDLWHRLRISGRVDPRNKDVYDYGLYLLDGILRESGKSLRDDFPSMPNWSQNWANISDNPLIAEQLNYNRDEERQMAEDNIRLLNPDQQHAFHRIMASVENNQGLTFFLNGPGGTGKTFLYKTLCNRVRSEGWIVLCVASSGIAALLMPGGRTAHSQFKIPIEGLTDDSLCSIRKESNLAGLLRATRLILWDEAPMQHRNTHEALEKTLRDIRDCEKPFGGVTMVFGGDFQQTLPVVPKGTQEEIVAASLPQSYIWSFIQSQDFDNVLRLRQNMRLDTGANEAEFADWLLDVGHGRGIRTDGKIDIPQDMQCATVDSLIKAIYPHIDGPTPPSEYFLDRIILAARNGDVDELNSAILGQMGGENIKYISADSIENEHGDQTERVNEIPVEYLRTLNAPGLPPGELDLKLGSPLILLRNLAPARGLCNGTRLVLRRASDRVLEAEIMGGRFHGEVAFIPRITLTPSGKDAEFAFTLRRRQFPVRLAFVLTINKAQGQSVRYVGLDLRVPVFSHGQLYVALSRATSRHRIKLLLPDASGAINIVYPEVLMD